GDVAGDVLLVATGRAPDVSGLALARAGIELAPGGAVLVDDHLRTTAPGVFACGDCTGGPQFTHHAGFQGFVAARNALFPGQSRGVREAPWTLFTEPEVAHVGLSESDAQRAHGADVVVTRWPLDRVDRAQAEHRPRGLFKVVHTRSGRVLGAAIAADRAGELAGEVALAIQKKATVADIAAAAHVYPTYAIGLQELALEATMARLTSGIRGRVMRALAFRVEPPGAPRKRWLFTVMGVTFAAQGIGKILDFSAYIAALDAFHFVPALALPVVGAVWIAAEMASGLALIATGLTGSPRPSVARLGAMTALAVSLAYALLDIQGYVRGLPIANCTCFGAYLAQRLSWFVLVQEAYVILLMSLLVRKAVRWRVVP
ncbi:MAG: FAD-dependent oxidoreductase, partial [Polyangiaceae bacterium]